MRELESTAASRARGVPVLAAPLHNACPGAPRNAAIANSFPCSSRNKCVLLSKGSINAALHALRNT